MIQLCPTSQQSHLQLITFTVLIYYAFAQRPFWPEVKINQGALRGRRMRTVNNKDFYGFIGIPYAVPPVEQLRFKKPVPHEGWRGVLQATTFKEGCPQFDSRGVELGNEDCLYLNVYTPKPERRNYGDLYPVMAYIHAESYENGDSSLYGPEKLLDKDVVLVTFNYRLGVLGFLSTGDDYASGNWGLYDQNLVLQWIKSNIINFSGNPNSVTLFGQGAGAASVFFHIVSPLSQGLLNRAIMQSGTGLCHWAFEENPLEYAKDVGAAVGCPIVSTGLLVDCLRTIPAAALLKAQSRGKSFGEFPQRAAPVTEKNVKGFLPDNPRVLLMKGEFNRIPVIIGLNKDEASYFYPLVTRSSPYGDPTYYEKSLIPRFLEAATPFKGPYKDRVMPAVLFSYFNNIDPANVSQVASRFINMSTDALYHSCIDATIKLYHEIGAPVYMYTFEYKGTNGMVSLLLNYGPTLFDTGVCHGDELFHLFDLKIGRLRAPSYTDNQVSHRILTLWTDFAKYGYAPHIINYEYPKWEPYHPDRRNYYRIGNDLTLQSSYKQAEAIFWSVNLPNISGAGPSVLARIYEARPMYKTLAWAMVIVSVTLLVLVLILLVVLYYQRRSQSFRAQAENGSSHLSTGTSSLY